MLNLVNAERARHGLHALAADSRLHAAAQQQCHHMAAIGAITHDGPGGSGVGDRISQAGANWTWAAENCAAGQHSEHDAMGSWMGSQGHRNNILAHQATHMGWAQVGQYWVQVFAKLPDGGDGGGSSGGWSGSHPSSSASDSVSAAHAHTPVTELRSRDGRFRFVMQQDRNIVLYKEGQGPIWASNTWTGDTGRGPFQLLLQTDGNLVGYEAGRQPFWASNTWRPEDQSGAPYRLVMQDDGNCVLYDNGNNAMWATNTWQHA